jgi:YegS/Rv2252/BmrU family lipid kinase
VPIDRARLIVNPASGTDRAPGLLPHINRRLRTIVDVLDITMTTSARDTEEAAARAMAGGYSALYVAGGDGTLNAVLRGLLRSGAERLASMPLGVIPLGTGNDFAKALGLSENAEVAVERLLERRSAAVDVGTLNDRPFVNTSSGGFVADVSEAVTEGLKDMAGKLAYLIGGARVLFASEPFGARLTPPAGAVPVDASWSGELALEMFAICNARMIGGGYPIAPHALIDDGLLDVFLVRQMPLFEFVRVLQTIGSGEHLADPRVLHFRAPGFDLQFTRSVRVNTDGELFETDRCEYRVLPRAALFFTGPDACTTAS